MVVVDGSEELSRLEKENVQNLLRVRCEASKSSQNQRTKILKALTCTNIVDRSHTFSLFHVLIIQHPSWSVSSCSFSFIEAFPRLLGSSYRVLRQAQLCIGRPGVSPY